MAEALAPVLASTTITPASTGTTAVSAATIQAVQHVERAIKDRHETDRSLINWWLYLLLVNPITFGIYGIFLYFKRIGRINGFIARKQRYYSGVVDYTQRYAEERGLAAGVQSEMNDLQLAAAEAFSSRLKPIRPWFSFLLTLVTLGIWSFVLLYRLNRIWNDLQLFESEFDERLSQAWLKLGLTKYPLTFAIDQSKQRSFGLNLLLTFVTFGIWTLVWDYRLHTDPNTLYSRFHEIEDTVLQTMRTA